MLMTIKYSITHLIYLKQVYVFKDHILIVQSSLELNKESKLSNNNRCLNSYVWPDSIFEILPDSIL